MRSLGKRITAAAVLAMAMVLFSCISAFAAESTVKISGYTSPSTLTQGTAYYLKGKISSNIKIKRVEIGVVDAEQNKWTTQKYDKKSVNSKSFDISNADSTIKFGKLKPGVYRYRIYAHTNDNKVHLLLNKKFTVTKKSSSSSTLSGITISGYNLPGTYKVGASFSPKGTISSGTKMSRVEIGIVNANTNKWTKNKYDKQIKSKSFDIAKAASAVKFNKVPAGSYRYRIYAHTSNGAVLLLNHKFTVKAVSTNAASTTVKTTTVNSDAAGIKLSGYNLPGTYKVGSNFKPKGVISSGTKIHRVEVGIVFAPTNRWTEYKYDKNINSKTFNIASAASSLDFNRLPGGTYRYRIYAHTSKGVVIVLNHKFTVTPSNKPQRAANWAKKIANDDTFAYGKSPETNDLGCYFCGTNQKNKPKGYEKTYVCLTFVGAAYAHGAKDPDILDRCRHGRVTMYENDSNFTRFDCWMKIGRCRDLSVDDLQVGDVIIQWSDDNGSGHVAMYAGNNSLVEAHTPGWGAGTISVNAGCAERRLRSLSGNALNYVMRYRY